jgi:hypothetical protein
VKKQATMEEHKFSRFRAKMAVFQTCFWVGFEGVSDKASA